MTIVIPSNRKDSIERFFREWDGYFGDNRVIVIEDHQSKTFHLPKEVEHYCWEDIDKKLGRNSWIIPRKTDGIRNFGFLLAEDDILTIDDDCFPLEGFTHIAEGHYTWLTSTAVTEWDNSVKGTAMRGVPYGIRNGHLVALSVGLWKGIPDYDAPTQLVGGGSFELGNHIVNKGVYYPMCGMNVAWRREITACMYYLPMGDDWGFHRFADIWAGIFSKKVLDHVGLAVHIGEPYVLHSRASNVFDNLKREASGIAENEIVWKEVDKVCLTKKTIPSAYLELWEKVNLHSPYWDKVRKAVKVWTTLISR